jgi:hypothetical protein
MASRSNSQGSYDTGSYEKQEGVRGFTSGDASLERERVHASELRAQADFIHIYDQSKVQSHLPSNKV